MGRIWDRTKEEIEYWLFDGPRVEREKEDKE